MSQRHSEYARQKADAYWTPQWVYDALYSVEDFPNPYDCAPRNADFDFLATNWKPANSQIVTNPPFRQAEAFVRHALAISERVAMLLPMTWDAAKTRRDLFESRISYEPCRFKAKYVITERIRWENLEQKKNGPSSNHAWFIWGEYHFEPAIMGWLP